MSEVGPRHLASSEVFRSASRQDGWPLSRNNFKREPQADPEPMEVEDLSVRKESPRSTPGPIVRSPYLLTGQSSDGGVDLSTSSRRLETPPSLHARHKGLARGADDIIVLSDEEAGNARLNGHHAHLNGSPGLEEWEAPKKRTPPALGSLGEEDLRRRRALVRRLREELRNEEMKLVLLKKVRQSQLLKETVSAAAPVASKAHAPSSTPMVNPTPRGGVNPPPPLVRGSSGSAPQPQAGSKSLSNHHHHHHHHHPHHHHHHHGGGSVRSPADSSPSVQQQLPPPLVGGVRLGSNASSAVAGMLLHQQQQNHSLLRGPGSLNPSSLARALSQPAAAHSNAVGYTSASQQSSVQQQQATSLSSSSPVPSSDGQTPAQRQAAAKLALRKQLEKTLLQIPPPKPPPPEMHFVPNANNPEFVYLLGLETVVTFLTEGETPSPPPPTPFSCLQCGLDFTAVWKWQDVRGAGSSRSRPPVICEACVTSNIKKALKAEHTHRLKTAFVKALQQEQEIEQRLASGGAPSPPPASTPPPAAHSPRLGSGSANFLPKLTPQQLLQAQQLQQLAQSLPPPQPAHMLPFAPLLAAYSYQMLGGKAPSAELQRQYLLDMIPSRSMAQGSVNWKT